MVCQEWEVLHISYTVYMSTSFLNPHFNSNDNNLTIIILLQKQTPCIIGILLFKRMEDIVLTISSSLVSLFLYVLVYVCRWYVHIHTSMLQECLWDVCHPLCLEWEWVELADSEEVCQASETCQGGVDT